MCTEKYAIEREKEIREMLEMFIEITGNDSDGACFVGQMVEADISGDILNLLIKYVAILRWKVMWKQGDHTMTIEEVDSQVRGEVVAVLTKRMNKHMQQFERLNLRN